ncbi:MAG: hypothetical protein AVDCRST_MAG18-2139, partial [uncultured Thermomicrobiales bacterium]
VSQGPSGHQGASDLFRADQRLRRVSGGVHPLRAQAGRIRHPQPVRFLPAQSRHLPRREADRRRQGHGTDPRAVRGEQGRRVGRGERGTEGQRRPADDRRTPRLLHLHRHLGRRLHGLRAEARAPPD